MSALPTIDPEDEMTLPDQNPSAARTLTEVFTVALFSVFTALIVLPGLVLAVVSIVSPGSIDLGPKP